VHPPCLLNSQVTLRHTQGHVTVQPQDDEDIWHLYNIIQAVRLLALPEDDSVLTSNARATSCARRQFGARHVMPTTLACSFVPLQSRAERDGNRLGDLAKTAHDALNSGLEDALLRNFLSFQLGCSNGHRGCGCDQWCCTRNHWACCLGERARSNELLPHIDD